MPFAYIRPGQVSGCCRLAPWETFQAQLLLSPSGPTASSMDRKCLIWVLRPAAGAGCIHCVSSWSWLMLGTWVLPTFPFPRALEWVLGRTWLSPGLRTPCGHYSPSHELGRCRGRFPLCFISHQCLTSVIPLYVHCHSVFVGKKRLV